MKLTTQQRLTFVAATVVLLRALKRLNATLTYKQFAEVIGLIEPDAQWQPWRRYQLSDVLDATSILAREKLDFSLVVNAKTGEPGSRWDRQPEIHP